MVRGRGALGITPEHACPHATQTHWMGVQPAAATAQAPPCMAGRLHAGYRTPPDVDAGVSHQASASLWLLLVYLINKEVSLEAGTKKQNQSMRAAPLPRTVGRPGVTLHLGPALLRTASEWGAGAAETEAQRDDTGCPGHTAPSWGRGHGWSACLSVLTL